MNKRLILLRSFTVRAAFALALAVPLFAQVADGDRHWNLRAQNKAEHSDAAIAAYQRAVNANANDMEAQWKLLRAYRFKGAYVTANSEEKKKVYAAAKVAGEKARAAADKLLGVNGKTPEKQVAEAAKKHPGSAEVYLWDAINWGEWALAYGKMAAAREGAADRIRRQATIAELVDPRIDNGTPSRVLGRLHDQTPRIPFITGWASSKEAVRFLNESYKIDPANKTTVVFLAEAMVSNDGKTKPQAIKLLRDTIAAPNHPDWLIEEMAAVEDAKALLRKWGA